MNIFKLIITTLILVLTLNTQTAFSKDRSYKFSVNGHSSDQISSQDDFAMKKAAEYALKKGYSHFVINNTRRFTKKARNGGGLGTRNSARPKPRTELNIHVYDADPRIEGSYEAASTLEQIENKYAE